MLTMLEKWVPFTYEAFLQYRKEGTRFSKNGVEALKKLIKGTSISQEESGMTKREWQEFTERLDLPS
jgi:thymidylate synthase (FAD)